MKIKGFGGVRVKGVGGHNAVSYEGVGLGFNRLHEIKAKTINFVFSISVKLKLLILYFLYQ